MAGGVRGEEEFLAVCTYNVSSIHDTRITGFLLKVVTSVKHEARRYARSDFCESEATSISLRSRSKIEHFAEPRQEDKERERERESINILRSCVVS